MVTKAHIRRNTLRLRDALSAEERREMSKAIIKRLIELPAYVDAECLITYVNYKSEVETEELIVHALKAGKQVYCPKVNGEEMDFYRITSPEELISGYKGIREPKESRDRLFYNKTIAKGKNIMVMPGCAFDPCRNRIGYGKGYYDRYIEKHIGLRTAAVCFECQIQEYIPADAHDKKPELLITEKRIFC